MSLAECIQAIRTCAGGERPFTFADPFMLLRYRRTMIVRVVVTVVLALMLGIAQAAMLPMRTDTLLARSPRAHRSRHAVRVILRSSRRVLKSDNFNLGIEQSQRHNSGV